MERQNKREAERAMAAAFKRNNRRSSAGWAGSLPPYPRGSRSGHPTVATRPHCSPTANPLESAQPEPLRLDHGPGKPEPTV